MDISETIKRITAQQLGCDAAKLADTDSFIDDLGADSLDTVELVTAFEDTFGVEVPDSEAETITTISDAIAIIDKLRAE